MRNESQNPSIEVMIVKKNDITYVSTLLCYKSRIKKKKSKICFMLQSDQYDNQGKGGKKILRGLMF